MSGANAGARAGPALEKSASSPVRASYAPTVITFRAVAGMLNEREGSRSTSRNCANLSSSEGLIQQSKSTSSAPVVSRNVMVHRPFAIGRWVPPGAAGVPAMLNAISCL